VYARVETADGVYLVDLAEGAVVAFDAGARLERTPPPAVGLPRVVAAAASGSTVVAVVDRRPPLVVSYDAGATWHEAGRGLPTGFAVAISGENPDTILFAARSRLYVSRDGGRFWSALALELPEIAALELD
jgi:photosystem II stability/assembly factor-like uncharacterized protein